MIKRIFDIVTFPFYFIYLFISFPFKIAKIIIEDKIEKRRNSKNTVLTKPSQNELIEIGQYLFSECYSDYKTFINSYLIDKKAFLSQNKDLLSNYDNFELDKLKPLEAIYIFGDSKQKLFWNDWRGEENEREIENFLEVKLEISTDWMNVNKLRKGDDEDKQRDGKFIIDLLKIIDKDLEPLNKKLVFFNLDWDAYVYTVVDQTSHKQIIKRFGTFFHGIESLRK
jgi:hypothetical protein